MACLMEACSLTDSGWSVCFPSLKKVCFSIHESTGTLSGLPAEFILRARVVRHSPPPKPADLLPLSDGVSFVLLFAGSTRFYTDLVVCLQIVDSEMSYVVQMGLSTCISKWTTRRNQVEL